jgi:hypothetical protein
MGVSIPHLDGNGIQSQRTLNAMLPLLAAAERIRLGLQTHRFVSDRWAGPRDCDHVVLVTDRAIHAAKVRLVGKPRLDISIPIDRVTGTGTRLQIDVGPRWEVIFDAGGIFYFHVNRGPDAERAAHVIGLGAEATRDPDVAHLARALDLGRQQPAGDAGKDLTPDQVVAESRRLRQLSALGRGQESWERRVHLGYGVPSDGVPQADRFWLDAAPAISALELGWKDHPMVAMCCGVAESSHDRTDPVQVAAVSEFNRLFFE